MPPEVERRLAAILSADVVGYSRLMAANEQSTVRTITAYREQISNLVGDHRGRVVDATGDNALAEFPTALDAVEAAVEIQRVLKARNAGLPEDLRMEFRIGVHMGDVTVESERIYGDGVNIAARLQGLAEPGGICISGAVHEQVRRKTELDFDDLGEQSVKNIPEPVRVFRVRAEAAVVEKVATPTTSDRPSIVVLPFANMSSDPEQDYFCDGMAEEVINLLAQLENLHVVARTSAFSFKGRDIDVRKIGNELGVGAVLEGSVRKAGDRLRITAQLINAEDGYHLWSESFDRQLDDVFAIQDEISANIVDALKVKLAIGTTRPKARRKESQEAYDLYLHGMHQDRQQTEPAFKKAIECFEQALALDPDYADAHAGVSEVYVNLSNFGLLSADEALPKAEAGAQRALELDDSLAQAHYALAHVGAWLKWDWEGAENEFRRAIELNPGLPEAHSSYASGCLSPLGRTQEAVAEILKAQALDPFSVVTSRTLGEALFFDRQYEEAIRQARFTVEVAPDLVLAHNNLAMAYSLNDRPEEALRSRQEIFRRTGREREARELEAAYAEAGEPGVLRWQIERGLPKAEKARAEGDGSNRAWSMALLYARLGETDDACRWLQEAVRQRDGFVIYAKVHPWLDSIRSDPRYDAILKTMNLAD